MNGVRKLRPRLLIAAVAVAGMAVLPAAGCGNTVLDDVKTEGAVEQDIESSLDKKVREVDCPSDVEVEAGTTFECSVTLADGGTETAKLRILNEDADVAFVDLSADK